MIRYQKRYWLLAGCLAAVAGYVDACGFLKLGGLFVSFMSGNSTRLGVGLASHLPTAVTAAALIATFVLGATAGALVAEVAGPRRNAAVLGFVTILLAIAAAMGTARSDGWSIGAVALAMGAENAVFLRSGEVSIGLTYMTGTLVKLGQRIAAAILGGDRWGWLPYLLLWAGLLLGAIAGAALYPVLGMSALWIAAGVAAALTVVAVLLGPAAEPS